jgi:hypothetical protein
MNGPPRAQAAIDYDYGSGGRIAAELTAAIVPDFSLGGWRVMCAAAGRNAAVSAGIRALFEGSILLLDGGRAASLRQRPDKSCHFFVSS